MGSKLLSSHSKIQRALASRSHPCFKSIREQIQPSKRLMTVQNVALGKAALRSAIEDEYGTKTGHQILKHCENLIQQKKEDNSYREFKRINRLANKFPFAEDHSIPKQAEEITMWCSNDYLAMSRHPEVVDVAIKAIEQHGTGAGGTRNISGTSLYHVDLETTIADWYNKDAGLLFSSCYVANETTLQTLGNLLPNCEIFSDKGNHASMIQGIRTSKAKRHIFNHNDPGHLECLLQQANPDTMKIVAFESIHSMSGNVCPLEELCDLSHRYGALTFIDEVHAVGLYGENGSGIGEMKNYLEHMDIISGTLGKGVGVTGGFIVGKASLVDVIRSYGPGFIFTTALPYDKAAAAAASIRILRSDEGKQLRKMHQATVATVKDLLMQKGLPVDSTPSHIVPIQVKDAELCNHISNELRRQYKIYIQAINYPTVPRGQEMLRIAPTPWHTLGMAKELAAAIDDLWSQFRLPRIHSDRV